MDNCRLEYEKLKSKCKEMEPSIGSRVVITMPLITEDGRPVETSRSNNGELPETEKCGGVNGYAEGSITDAELPESGSGGTEGLMQSKKEPLIESKPVDQTVVQWKLSLHQIGRYVKSNRSCYVLGQVKFLPGQEFLVKEQIGSDTRHLDLP